MSRISENEQAKPKVAINMTIKVTQKVLSTLIFAITLPLSGCGQKGPLTMPEEPKQNEAAEQKPQPKNDA